MQAVILSFDSLAANSLGCYGNVWIETPHWDRLATAGVVFDRHFADTVGPHSGMAWANGQHALTPANPSTPTSVGHGLRSSGVATKLIVAGELQTWQRHAEFDEIRTVEGKNEPGAKPDEVPVAKLVQAGLSAWNEDSFAKVPRLLWLHAPPPGHPPEGFDSLYFEDFEERGQQISELSDEARAEHPAVYAGSVSLLDHWLGELLAGIEAVGSDQPTLIIVMAAKGYLWHPTTGSAKSDLQNPRLSLSDQCIRAPLVLKIDRDDRYRDFSCLRTNRLVQTCDLVPTLLDWFGVAPIIPQPLLAGQSWLRELTEEVAPRSRLQIVDEGCLDAVRTADWLCVRDRFLESVPDLSTSNPASRVSLFVKPEDIWDVNDVASQQPEVISELLEHETSENRS